MKKLALLALMCLCAHALMGQNASPLPVPKIQFFDSSGRPLAGGFVFTYAAGTTTPLSTYTDSTGGTPNANPVPLDAGGFANIWLLGSECYKILVQNSGNVQVSSTDNICAPVNGSSLNVSLASPPPIGITIPSSVYSTFVDNANRFQGATADVQIANALTYDCANGIKTLSLKKMANLTIASTVSMGCPSGAPIKLQLDASQTFVPSATNINMFTWLPGAQADGCLSADVSGVSGYAGNVLQLVGNVYDNQPGNLTGSKGQTILPCAFIKGGTNITGTALYLSGTNATTEYIEFVLSGGQIAVSGMLYGIHAFSDTNGWINSNELNLRCASTIHCATFETGAAGSIIGNYGIISEEYVTSFFGSPNHVLDGIYYKGTGEVADNQFIARFWDWGDLVSGCTAGPPTCATLRADSGLAHNFGNTADGMVYATDIVDPNLTLHGYDSVDDTYYGNLMNTRTSGFLRYPQLFVQGGTQTATNLVTVNTHTLTSGLGMWMFQDTSAFSGTGIQLDFAHSTGTFTGNFIEAFNNTVSKFKVDSAGNILAAGAIGGGGDGSGTHCLLDSIPSAYGPCMSGGTGLTSLGFKNAGSAFGTMTSAGSINCVGCVVSGADPNFTISAIGGSGTTGFFPKLASATTLGNSHLDDGVTTASKITSSEWLVAPEVSSMTYDEGGQVYNACDPLYGLDCTGGSDSTTAMAALITTVASTNHAGTIVFSPVGHHVRIDTARLTFPANVHLKGCGRSTYNVVTGFSTAPCGLDMRFNDASCKMLFNGNGVNMIQDMSFIDGGTDTAWFVCDTNSSAHFDRDSWQGTKTCSGGACSTVSNGAIQFGGTSNSYSATLPAGYYTGYPSSVTDNLWDKIGIAAQANTNANDITIRGGYVSSTSGNPTGGAVMGNGFNTSGNGAQGNTVRDLGIEVTNYKYGIQLANSASWTLSGNICWDYTNGTTTSCYRFESTTSSIHGDIGLYQYGSTGLVGVSDAGGLNCIYDPFFGWIGAVCAKRTISGLYSQDVNHSKNLTSGSPTTVLTIPLTSGKAIGGMINYMIAAHDGTNNCVASGHFNWSGENTSGTFVVLPNGGSPPANEAITCTAAKTLTDTWQLVGTSPATLQVTATTNITTTVFYVTYTWNSQGETSPTE